MTFEQRLQDEREQAGGHTGGERFSRGNRPFPFPHVAFRGGQDEFLGDLVQPTVQTGVSLSPVWLVAVTSVWMCLVLGRSLLQ